jgi:Fe-S oxidoreductase
VACPYCLQMFEDSVKTLDLDLEVKDISELVAESL